MNSAEWQKVDDLIRNIKDIQAIYWKSLEYPAPWGGDESDLRFLAVGGADTYSKAVALIPRPLGGGVNFIIIVAMDFFPESRVLAGSNQYKNV